MQLRPGQAAPSPDWPSLSYPASCNNVTRGNGLTLEVSGIPGGASATAQFLVDGRPGVVLQRTTAGAVVLRLQGDSGLQAEVGTDPVCTRVLNQMGPHHVVAVADFSALVARLFVDGVSCDGGGIVPRGWSFLPAVGQIHSGAGVTAGQGLGYARVYTRALLAGEVIGNMRSGLGHTGRDAAHRQE